jgi:hypothetical protein
MRSQRPPAKPEAWRRWSGPWPLGPAGGTSLPLHNPRVISSRPRGANRLGPVPPPVHSILEPNGSSQLFRDPNLWLSLQLPPHFPSTHIPGTVKLRESLQQSWRIYLGLSARSRSRPIPGSGLANPYPRLDASRAKAGRLPAASSVLGRGLVEHLPDKLGQLADGVRLGQEVATFHQ